MPKPSSGLRRTTLRALSAAAILSCTMGIAPSALAQAYPDKPVKIVVGFAPGGTNDILARLIATKLQDRLGQPFVVDNKPGANSGVGTGFVAKSKADGYTLLVSSSGGLTVNPVLMKNPGYDPTQDFEPVAWLSSFPLMVTVPAASPAKTYAELVSLTKSSPDGLLDHGVASSSFQLVAETLGSASNIKFNHINYRGSGPVVVGLLGNEIKVGVLDSAAVATQVAAGKLRALAVTTGKRSTAFPDIPTVAESGVPGYDEPIWTALMAPKGTPEPVLAKLRTAVGEILKDKDVAERMRTMGMEPGNTDGPALTQRIANDIARWSKVAKAANMQPQ